MNKNLKAALITVGFLGGYAAIVTLCAWKIEVFFALLAVGVFALVFLAVRSEID